MEENYLDSYGLTVGELIEKLKKYNSNMKVAIHIPVNDGYDSELVRIDEIYEESNPDNSSEKYIEFGYTEPEFMY